MKTESVNYLQRVLNLEYSVRILKARQGLGVMAHHKIQVLADVTAAPMTLEHKLCTLEQQRRLRGVFLGRKLGQPDEYWTLSPAAVGELVRRRLLLYARNVLDASVWKAAGWTVRGLVSDPAHWFRSRSPASRTVLLTRPFHAAWLVSPGRSATAGLRDETPFPRGAPGRSRRYQKCRW